MYVDCYFSNIKNILKPCLRRKVISISYVYSKNILLLAAKVLKSRFEILALKYSAFVIDEI